MLSKKVKKALRHAVKAGANFLDVVDFSDARINGEVNLPWFDEDSINTDTLRLEDGTYCVIGQRYGSYSFVRTGLKLQPKTVYALGFNIDFAWFPDDTYGDQVDAAYAYLGRQWIKEIEKRRNRRDAPKWF